MTSISHQPKQASDLHSCTRQQLLVLAGKAQIRGRHRMTKDQLIAALGARTTAASPGRQPTASMRAATRTAARADMPSPESPESAPTAGRAPQPASCGSLSGAAAEPEVRNLTELPSSYGRTRLTLMAIDPYRIHAYWEITSQDHETALSRLGSERAAARWVLRFYDVSYIDFDGTNAHSHFDLPIDLSAGNWYVNLWSSEKSYCADIGALAPSGRFELACRSNFVDMPRAEPSPHYRPEWLHVEELGAPGEPVTMTAAVAAPRAPETVPAITEADVRTYYDELLEARAPDAASQPSPAPTAGPPTPFIEQTPAESPHDAAPAPAASETNPMPSPAPAAPEALRSGSLGPLRVHRQARLPETVSSFGSGGWVARGRAAVELKVNAELILSGRTQPGQTLQVNGQWLTVNADGTFSLRLALPVRE